MSPETPRLAAWLKALDPENLLKWFAQTAEESMGIDYELSQLRSQDTTTEDIE
ncbi:MULTISPECIES: hypothetical protein [Methylomicrobium]|uniref:Uncharacterized protein n=1 Tax=Methylomicrobium album BG8 TaxID=686340 RepID=H8GLN2_METAL|nr:MULTISPECIES: hypothetical protein [Methylomicrobium]EIC30559.1 hypothetical protein Metal_2873 [Methylomicrobium album BG8]